MKLFKYIFTILFTGLLLFALNACKKCKDEDPRSRVINNSSDTAKIQVTSNGKTVYLDVVDPGTSTSYNNYETGENIITINMPKMLYAYLGEFEKCYDYDVIIDPYKNISVTVSDRNKR